MSSCETACNVGCSNATDLETITRCSRIKRHLTLLFVDKGLPPISARTYCGVVGEESLMATVSADEPPEHEMVAAAKLFGRDPSADVGQPELKTPSVFSGLDAVDSLPEYAAGEPVSLDESVRNFYA